MCSQVLTQTIRMLYKDDVSMAASVNKRNTAASLVQVCSGRVPRGKLGYNGSVASRKVPPYSLDFLASTRNVTYAAGFLAT